MSQQQKGINSSLRSVSVSDAKVAMLSTEQQGPGWLAVLYKAGCFQYGNHVTV